MVYEVHVTLNRKFYSNMLVTAVLSNNGAEYASGKIPFDEVGTKVIQMKVGNLKACKVLELLYSTMHLSNTGLVDEIVGHC